MLHACFQILENYFVREACGIAQTNWTHSVDARERWKELSELRAWWAVRSKSEWPDEEAKDDEMLMRLLKIRRTLWT